MVSCVGFATLSQLLFLHYAVEVMRIVIDVMSPAPDQHYLTGCYCICSLRAISEE